MNEQERWRPIEGFEGLYDVSNQGRVYSHKTNKFMSPQKNRNGYLHVCLRKNGKPMTNKIHRLVAQAFIPNPENYPQINHKNEDKTDNSVENLEWCNQQYNNEFSQASYWVLFDPSDERIEIYNIVKFSREKGLDAAALQYVATGKKNSFYGYTSKPGTKLNKTGSFRLISPEGEAVTFENQERAKDYIETTNISNLLYGRQKSVKGWTLPDEH